MAKPVYDPRADAERAPEPDDLSSSQSTPAGKPYDPRGHDVAAGNPSDPRGDGLDSVRNAENGPGFYNSNGDSGTSSGDLQNAEQAGNGEGGMASGFDALNSTSTGGGRRRFITRRRAIIGGVGGLTATGVIIAFFSLSTGPLEFIHLAQLLERFHFSSQENAENNRLEKIVRFLNDPERPERTRMGIVGNAIADKLETKIHDATGLSPDFENGSFKGYIADPKHDNFNGKTLDEMKATMADQLGVDISFIDVTTNKNGVKVPIFNPDTGGFNTFKNYQNQISTARGLFTEAGFNNISAHVSARVLRTRAGWTFHPIRALDSTVQEQLLKASKAAIDKLKEQFNSQEETIITSDTTVPSTPESSNEQDKSGKPVNDPTRTDAANAGNSVQSDPSETNIKTKIAGGGAALIGVACVMHGIDDSIPKLREAKVILPMMKFAGQFMSLGSQAQSGQDIDTTQLGFYKQFLDGTDSSGNVTSTWNQAQSIQAELGEPQNGTDIPKSAQVFNAGVPFGFIEGIPGLGTICGILGSPLGTIVSIVLTPFSTAFQSVAISPLISDFANWLSGVPIDIFKGAGAVDGNYINYGSRLAANEQFASAGGVQLSSSQETSLKNTTALLDNAQFQSKSLAYRIFNPNDDQTLASKIMDSYGSSGAVQGFASIASNFGNIFSSTLRSFGSLFTGFTHAATPTYDYHGLKAVGFTVDDLANPAYSNPFANACAVTGGQGCPNATGILGDPNNPNQTYIDRAQTCFGDTISPDGGSWDISFASNQPTDMAYANDTDYKNAGCADTDPNWTRVRFWIMDTQTIEGYDCYASNTSISDQSCQDVGDTANASTSSSSGTTSNGSLPTGSAQDLAKQILANKNIKEVGTDVTTDLQDAAAGQPASAGKPLSQTLLALLVYMGQNHTFNISALESGGSGHSGPGDPHYEGDAVDITGLDGDPIANSGIGRTPHDQTLISQIAPLMPKSTGSDFYHSSGFGQDQCGPTPPLPSGIVSFDDTCSHLHIQIPVGSP